MTIETLTTAIHLEQKIKQLRIAIKNIKKPITTVSVNVGVDDGYIPLAGLLDPAVLEAAMLDIIRDELLSTITKLAELSAEKE